MLDKEELANRYKLVQAFAAKKLASTADVFCLQEVAIGGQRDTVKTINKDTIKSCRPEMDALSDKGFEFFFNEKVKKSGKLVEPAQCDAVIAINPSRFKDAKNRSYYDPLAGADVAFVVATDIQSGKKVAFVTAHVPGFNLSEPDETTRKAGASQGDEHCRDIIRKIETAGLEERCDLVVFGGDLNAYREAHSTRHEIFEGAGFKMLASGKSTNIEQTVEGNAFRKELDYMAIREKAEPEAKGLEKIKEFFTRKRVKAKVLTKKMTSSFDSSEDVSDHKALIMRVRIATDAEAAKMKVEKIALRAGDWFAKKFKKLTGSE